MLLHCSSLPGTNRKKPNTNLCPAVRKTHTSSFDCICLKCFLHFNVLFFLILSKCIFDATVSPLWKHKKNADMVERPSVNSGLAKPVCLHNLNVSLQNPFENKIQKSLETTFFFPFHFTFILNSNKRLRSLKIQYNDNNKMH